MGKTKLKASPHRPTSKIFNQHLLKNKGANTEVTEAYLTPSFLFLFPFFTIQQDVLPLKTTSVSDAWLALPSRAYREKAGCTKASDASQHCVTLAVAAVVNVDLESWQLLRVQLVLSFPPDKRGLDNAWSLRQELNLLGCKSQINKAGKQWRESAALLIWFGCRMFPAFHTQVILGIFFSVGGKGKADYTDAQCVPVCVRDSAGLCV